MSISAFILSWSPVALVALLVIVFRCSALALSILATLFTVLLAFVAFDTPITVILPAALDGFVTTLPLLLVVFAGILLSILLSATGSLKRIVEWLLGSVRDGFHRIILISFGAGNFMEGAGVIAEPVIAPMLRESGLDPRGAAALSLIGYSGLMTLEMAGIIITVLSLVTGIPIAELARASAVLSIVACVSTGLCAIPFLIGSRRAWGKVLCLVGAGALLGLIALAVVFLGPVSLSGMAAGTALIAVILAAGPRGLSLRGIPWRDCAPFGLVVAALLIVNSVPPIRELTLHKLALSVHVVPRHAITFTPFFSAYLYLALAFVLAVRLLRVPREKVRSILRDGVSKAWRASIAMGLFGAMGQIIAYSGYASGFSEVRNEMNMPWIMSHGLQAYTGNLYPLFVPLLGWIGTFLTGYGVASLMLFGVLQIQTAQLLGCSPTWLAAALAVGASLGSMSSPFKIALAAPMCGALGQEGRILRLTIPLGIASSFVVGLVLWLIVNR